MRGKQHYSRRIALFLILLLTLGTFAQAEVFGVGANEAVYADAVEEAQSETPETALPEVAEVSEATTPTGVIRFESERYVLAPGMETARIQLEYALIDGSVRDIRLNVPEGLALPELSGWQIDEALSEGVLTGIAQVSLSRPAMGQYALVADLPDGTQARTTILSEGLRLPEESLSLTAGQTALLQPEYCLAQDDAVLRWTSSDPEVAAVAPTGVLTALAEGRSVITVGVEGREDLLATCEVEVAPATAVLPQKLTLGVGERRDLSEIAAAVYPGCAIAYKSSSAKIATVKASGVVQGKKAAPRSR